MDKVKINGKEKELNWVDRQDGWGGHHEVDGIPFNGHRVLWSFSYEPETYLKESELSGDEWRKGGSIKIIRNGLCVLSEFCRHPERAANVMREKLEACQEVDWDKVVEGKKLYYKDQAAFIERVLDEGELILKKENGESFQLWAFEQEEIKQGEMTEADRDWKETTKVHATDKNIWWWRN
jgi:hypothetical protein